MFKPCRILLFLFQLFLIPSEVCNIIDSNLLKIIFVHDNPFNFRFVNIITDHDLLIVRPRSIFHFFLLLSFIHDRIQKTVNSLQKVSLQIFVELRVVLFYKFPVLFPKKVCLDRRPCPVVITAPFLIAALKPADHGALWLSKDV